MSSLYIELMNEFGRSGGFDALIALVKGKIDEKLPLPVDHLFGYLEFMHSPSNLFHRGYIVNSVTPFVDAVLRYMSAIPDEELRNVRREKLDSALIHIDSLLRRVYTAKTKGEQFIKLKVGIAVSLLRSDLLERRIQAIRMIAETCKAAKSSQMAAYYSSLPTANDSAVLNGLLQVPKVIEEIFGKRSHIQLILRSSEILSFFLLNGNMGRKEFDLIWQCCEQDEQSKVEILKVISEASGLLPAELIGLIVEKYAAMDKTQFKDQDVALLHELGGRHAKPTPAVLCKILDIMWEVIVGEISGISIEVSNKIMERFCDVITSPALVQEATMQEYFGKVYVMLKEVRRGR